jgi:uncharacterized protein YneF (UPF0154 family)
MSWDFPIDFWMGLLIGTVFTYIGLALGNWLNRRRCR